MIGLYQSARLWGTMTKPHSPDAKLRSGGVADTGPLAGASRALRNGARRSYTNKRSRCAPGSTQTAGDTQNKQASWPLLQELTATGDVFVPERTRW